jgi:hypothetical protein
MPLNKKLYFLAMVGLLATSACSGPSLYSPLPQSNFAYPNSDVTPMSHVVGSAKRSYFMPFQTPEFSDATMRREAYADALSKSGGDLIIDGDYTVKTTMIPILIGELFTVEARVEGTAARMTALGDRVKASQGSVQR